MSEIKVSLMRRAGRDGIWEAYWIDPISLKQKTRTTGTKKHSDAVRFAAKKELELNSDSVAPDGNWTFATASERYLAEHLSSRAVGTQKSWIGTRNRIVELIDPKFLSAFSASLCSKFGGELRGTGMAEATIKKHLATLKAFLNWCNKLGGLRVMPQILLPKRVNKMRGRAITLEEFERYRETIRTATVSKCNRLGTQRKPLSKLIPDHLQDEIIRLVDGLWLSGLRLDEALELGWDTGEIRIIIAQDKPPRLKIEANADKSTESRILPLAPDFGEFLLQTPVGKRRGRVFRPVVPGQIGEMRLDTMSKVLERIGHRAGILEYEKPPKKGSKVTQKKWASAHSFRRAFGTRHAKYLSPLELMILMRHKNIKTTMDFYLDANAETVETAIAAKSPNKTPNIETKSAFPNARKG